MARKLRIEYAGALYYVTARGNDRQGIFRTDADRVHLLTVSGYVHLNPLRTRAWGAKPARTETD